MAWYEDLDGIAPVCQSHRAHGFGIADAVRELCVGNRLSIRNRTQRVPNAKLEARSFQRKRQIELFQLAAEVGLQLTDDFGKRRSVLRPVSLRRRCMFAAFEAHQPQPVRIAPKQQRPDGTLKRCVKHLVHFLRSFFDAHASTTATALPARYTIVISSY